MIRNPRNTPVAGDMLRIHLSEWLVDSVCGESVALLRGGAYTEIKLCQYREIFKFAEVMKHGDDKK